MRVATLQFHTTPGRFDDNATRARELLSQVEPGSLDLLVLPEMALSGYNFTSAEHIDAHLELTNSGPSFHFAVETAKRLQCIVIIGYPETCSVAGSNEEEPHLEVHAGRKYNTVVSVSSDGGCIATYRKHHLYYTDQTWASPGPGFPSGLSELNLRDKSTVQIAQGICMDLNPRGFERERWSLFEFASHVVSRPEVGLVVLSNAWNLSAPGTEGFSALENTAWWELIKIRAEAKKPSISTIEYWVERLWPLVTDSRERAVVIGNRCGTETDARYAGSSCVLIVGLGNIQLVGFMGVAEEGVGQFDVDVASLQIGAEATNAHNEKEIVL